MQTERSISSKLAQQLDKLPMPADSSFKKEAAWEKLHDRLRNTKRKRRKAAFIAGISVPVAASLFYFLLTPGNNKQDAEKTTRANFSQPKVAVTPANRTAPTNNSTVVNSTKDIANRITVKKKETPDSNREDHKETIAINPVVVAPMIDSLSTQNVIVTAPVIKKKLRVVHNNELGGPVVAAPDVEKNAMAIARPGLFPGFRKPGFNSFEEPGDTITKQKPKRSLLPFNSFISQKE